MNAKRRASPSAMATRCLPQGPRRHRKAETCLRPRLRRPGRTRTSGASSPCSVAGETDPLHGWRREQVDVGRVDRRPHRHPIRASGPIGALVLNVHSRGPPADQFDWQQHRRTCPCVTGTSSAVGLWKVESFTDLEAGLPVAIDHLRDHHSNSLPTNSTEGIRPTMAGRNDPDGGQERSK